MMPQKNILNLTINHFNIFQFQAYSFDYGELLVIDVIGLFGLKGHYILCFLLAGWSLRSLEPNIQPLRD